MERPCQGHGIVLSFYTCGHLYRRCRVGKNSHFRLSPCISANHLPVEDTTIHSPGTAHPHKAARPMPEGGQPQPGKTQQHCLALRAPVTLEKIQRRSRRSTSQRSRSRLTRLLSEAPSTTTPRPKTRAATSKGRHNTHLTLHKPDPSRTVRDDVQP